MKKEGGGCQDVIFAKSQCQNNLRALQVMYNYKTRRGCRDVTPTFVLYNDQVGAREVRKCRNETLTKYCTVK